MSATLVEPPTEPLLHLFHIHRQIAEALFARPPVPQIAAAFTASRSTYCSTRLVHALRAKGLCHGNNRIARLMREQHLRVRQKRRFVPRTTVADKTATAAPNHLLQRSSPQRLNEIWVTDITYLPTREG